MAVEMDWVGNGLCGFDDEVVPFICGVHLYDVGRGRESRAVLVDLEESGVCPFDDEGGGCHVPFEDVVGAADSYCLSRLSGLISSV